MKLYQFNQWKSEAIAYWTNTISASPNGLQGTPASGTQPHYSNSTILSSNVLQILNDLQIKFDAYMVDASLLDKTKDSLISMMSYVSMRDIVTVVGGPSLTTLVTDMRNWYSYYTYDLPEKETLFDLYPEIVTSSVSATTNSELIQQGIWYTQQPWPVEPPVSGGEYYNSNGVCSNKAISGVNFDTFISNDINTMNVFSIANQTMSKDAIIYRMYGEPEMISTYKKPKPVVLNDYHFQTVLDDFGWTIQGLN